jgi:hypothetical protein
VGVRRAPHLCHGRNVVKGPDGPAGQPGRLPWIWPRISSRTIRRQATSCRRVQWPRYAGSRARNASARGVGRVIGSRPIAPERTGRPPRPAGASIPRSSSAAPSSSVADQDALQVGDLLRRPAQQLPPVPRRVLVGLLRRRLPGIAPIRPARRPGRGSRARSATAADLNLLATRPVATTPGPAIVSGPWPSTRPGHRRLDALVIAPGCRTTGRGSRRRYKNS